MKLILALLLAVLFAVSTSYSQDAEHVFTSLDEALKSPDKVYHLNLREKGIKQIPPEIGKLVNLRSLDLSYNPFLKLPPQFGQLKNLEKLTLRCTRLPGLPEVIAQCSNLKILDYGGNMDCEHPVRLPRADFSVLGRLKNLRDLNIALIDDLKVFPLPICNLRKLERLSITFSDITAIPPQISKLTALRVLNLEVNKIRRLPSEITRLERLERLELTQNRLTSLPPEIGRLTRLKTLGLGNLFDPEDGNIFTDKEKKRIRRWLPNTEIGFDE
jgi:Leucine-rich repeat (LRR) protein